MTDEERQRTIDFILQQQAQLTATVGKLSEKVDRTADSVTALLAVGQIHDHEIGELRATVDKLAETVRTVNETAQTVNETARNTDERLNILISTIERQISSKADAPPNPDAS